ncbi:MAG: MBL fold metallo-hydrolase [Pyrinomonadaceae bacterium]
MKKWLVRIVIFILMVVIALVGAAFWSDSDEQVVTRYVKNESVPVIRDGWPGNAVDRRGRFINHEHPFLPKALDLLHWQLGTNHFKDEKKNDTFRLEVRDSSEFLASDRDGIVWLGHATFFIRLNGVGILTDPVFGSPAFVKRYVDVPSPLDNLKTVDYVLLSHDHRDHTDEDSIRAIAERFPKARFLGGLRMDELAGEWDIARERWLTTGWFQPFGTGDERVEIYFLPVRHWSRRGLADTNWRLWGGFVIRSAKATIYFGGDSGYGRHYRETGELFPNIDHFLIGIGAYEPRWFMEPNHNNPSDVVKAFVDSGAKTLVPMHYATFDLSDEPPGQPLRLLREEAEKADVADRVRPIAIGESIAIGGQ